MYFQNSNGDSVSPRNPPPPPPQHNTTKNTAVDLIDVDAVFYTV